MLCILMVAMAVIIIITAMIDNKKKSPSERNLTVENNEGEIETEAAGNIDSESVNEKNDDEENEEDENEDSYIDMAPEDNVINIQGLQMEIESYDVVDRYDIQSQDKYPEENFEGGVYPDPDYQPELIWADEDKMFEEAPELKEYMRAEFGKYTSEEIMAVREKYKDVEEKYTTYTYPNYKYYFLKLKVTNTSKNPVPFDVMLDTTYVWSGDNTCPHCGLKSDVSEGCVYFDKATSDGDNFYLTSLAVGGEIEYTVGVIVYDYEDAHIYWGDVDSAGVGSDGQFNPEKMPNLVDIDSVKKIDNK